MSSKQGTQPPSASRKQKPKQQQTSQPKQSSQPKQTTYANSPQMQAVQEARREAAKERQQAAQAAAQRRRRTVRMQRIAIVAAIAIVIVGGITAYFVNEANKPGDLVAQQPSPHLGSETEAHAAYITDPPTSGPHVPSVPDWVVYDKPIAKELQVHALEDAGVVINYQPNLDKATVDRLAALARSYNTQVLMSPYDNLSNPIVLTAWRRIQRFNTFDEVAIKRFIDAYRGIDHHKESGS